MTIKPLIHTNVDILKSKLQKYEPIKIARRIGIDATIVIAIEKLTYDKNIPTLKEKHLKKYQPPPINESKKRKVTPRVESGGDEPFDEAKKRLQHGLGDNLIHLNGGPQHQVENSPQLSQERSPIQMLDDGPANKSDNGHKVIQEITIDDSSEDEQQELECEQQDIEDKHQDLKDKQQDLEDDNQADEEMPEDRREGEPKDRPNCNHDEFDDNLDEEDEDDDEENQGVICQSSIDELVLTGPDEDEFRQYSDDEDEEETTLSKNLKKIRTEPPPPPPPPKQVASTLAPQRRPPEPANIRAPAVPAHPPAVLGIAEIEKLLEVKNFKLVYAELNRQKATFKNDQTARSILKKGIFSCLERDDTFMLLEFLGLVFDYNYLCDTKFWDELIGKLKRKDNPHAKCLTFKCDVAPKLVLHNYRLTVRKIAEHFDSNNPTIALPWLSYRYLGESTMNPTANNNFIPSSSMGPTPVLKQNGEISPRLETAQENLDPAGGARDISYFQDTDGKRKYKVKVPKGERKFSAII